MKLGGIGIPELFLILVVMFLTMGLPALIVYKLVSGSSKEKEASSTPLHPAKTYVYPSNGAPFPPPTGAPVSSPGSIPQEAVFRGHASVQRPIPPGNAAVLTSESPVETSGSFLTSSSVSVPLHQFEPPNAASAPQFVSGDPEDPSNGSSK